MTASILSSFRNLNPGSWLFLVWALVTGCTSNRLPALLPLEHGSVPAIEESCRNLFVKENTQFIHLLEVHLPDQSISSVIGITNVFPETRALESLIMSVEGLVLFHTRFEQGSKNVLRSIKPFSSEAFSNGLLKDIELIFLKPDGTLVQSGLAESKATVCRFQTGESERIDIRLYADQNWEIQKYDAQGQPVRLVKAFIGLSDGNASNRKPNRPEKIILEGQGLFGYTLIMTLWETDPIINN